MSGSPVKACRRCGKERQVNYDRRNYCVSCRDDALRPIATWMEHGSCRDSAYDPDWWWPDHSDPHGGAVPLALRICGQCPVRDLCLDYALKHGERHGLWGGHLPSARNALAASRRTRKAS